MSQHGDGSCSGCGRDLTAEPMAICPNVIHWRAWSEELKAKLLQVCAPVRHSPRGGDCGDPICDCGDPTCFWCHGKPIL
jgi:hypothetical protein